MAAEIPPLEQREFAPSSKRTGVIAIKAGMTQDWDTNNAFVPLTVLWIDNCQVRLEQRAHSYACTMAQVIEVSPKENGDFRLQLGCGFKKTKNTPRHVKKEFRELRMPVKSKTADFIVSADGVLPVSLFSLPNAHTIDQRCRLGRNACHCGALHSRAVHRRQRNHYWKRISGYD